MEKKMERQPIRPDRMLDRKVRFAIRKVDKGKCLLNGRVIVRMTLDMKSKKESDEKISFQIIIL